MNLLIKIDQLNQMISEQFKKYLSDLSVSDVIKQNYNIYINRNIISKLWNNQISLPDYLQNTQEYKDMLSNEKKRTKKLIKFTEDELDFIKNNSHLDLSNCANVFYSKFNKTITKEYISQLIKSKK